MAGKAYGLAARLVGEVAKPRLVSVKPEDPIEYVRRVMRDYGLRVVAVAERGRLIGVISRSEILTVTGTKSEAKAKDLAVQPKVALSPDYPLLKAVREMLSVDEWYAPIVEGGVFKGFLGLEDVIELALIEERSLLESLKLEDVMSRNPIAVRIHDRVNSIWRLMREYRYAGLPVVDDRGVLVGIITQYDLLRKGYSRIHLEAARGHAKSPKVSNVMTRPCTYLYPWSTLLEASEIMVSRNIGRIPVVDSEKNKHLIGIVDREDAVRALLR
ncbi:MAG: CBS domain-containing protein [Thermoprotei archaeon]|nr:CBS domain-containing protein [Thermoprotei archaeon]